MGKQLKLLSLDGGGVRGVLTVPVLTFLEEQLKKPLWQCFDYICGVSTGAFQATALTMPQARPASALSDLYTRYASTIFSRHWYSTVTNPYGMSEATYGAEGIEGALMATYSYHTLSEAKTPTMVLAYDCDASQAVYFQSWAPSGQYLLKDVLRASSAAPTYFPPAQIKIAGQAARTFIDGGMVANNPVLDCMVEACRREGANVRDCTVLSVGTGMVERKYAYNDLNSWGKLSWVVPALDITMDGSSDLDDYRMGQIMPDAQYLRCQTRLPAALGTLDNADPANLAALTAAGEHMVVAMRDKLMAFCDRLLV